MEWIIKIENKPDQRIKINFDPKNELIIFHGQYKPHNKEWVDFSEESYSIDIDLETIQKLLVDTYDAMKQRLDVYKDLSDSFGVLKIIEIDED